MTIIYPSRDLCSISAKILNQNKPQNYQQFLPRLEKEFETLREKYTALLEETYNTNINQIKKLSKTPFESTEYLNHAKRLLDKMIDDHKSLVIKMIHDTVAQLSLNVFLTNFKIKMEELLRDVIPSLRLLLRSIDQQMATLIEITKKHRKAPEFEIPLLFPPIVAPYLIDSLKKKISLLPETFSDKILPEVQKLLQEYSDRITKTIQEQLPEFDRVLVQIYEFIRTDGEPSSPITTVAVDVHEPQTTENKPLKSVMKKEVRRSPSKQLLKVIQPKIENKSEEKHVVFNSVGIDSNFSSQIIGDMNIMYQELIEKIKKMELKPNLDSYLNIQMELGQYVTDLNELFSSNTKYRIFRNLN